MGDFLKVYWGLYGGRGALISSPYLWISLFLLGFLFPLWVFDEVGKVWWPPISLSVSPSLLGFSLGGMAILLAFSNETLLVAVRQDGRPDSVFMKAIVSFFHAIFIQILVILLAIVASALESVRGGLFSNFISCFGFFTFMYSILIMLGLAGSLLQVARIFNAATGIDADSLKRSRLSKKDPKNPD